MILRHINRGDIREGGCPLCKPRMSRRGWARHYYGEHPADHYEYEIGADDEEDDDGDGIAGGGDLK